MATCFFFCSESAALTLNPTGRTAWIFDDASPSISSASSSVRRDRLWTYGERLTNGAWLPEAKVKSRLRSTLLATTPAVEEQLGARSLDLAAIRASMEDADVDSVLREGPMIA